MSEDGSTGETLGGRKDNGLPASIFAIMGEVDPRVSRDLLDTLARASIAAYTAPSPPRRAAYPYGATSVSPHRPLDSIYVDEAQTAAAKEIVEPLLAKNDQH